MALCIDGMNKTLSDNPKIFAICVLCETKAHARCVSQLLITVLHVVGHLLCVSSIMNFMNVISLSLLF